ncbi:MAG TPA: HAD family phosphatase [Nocardioidaceae bacterium]|nr:HAD family phosphatase [Nocardioidaceae bacterium]
MPPTAVVFDIGGVLVDWDPRYLFRDVISDDATREWFLREVCPPEWNLEQDRGRPWADAVTEATGRHPDHAGWIRAYDERWLETIGGVDEAVADLVRDLRRTGMPTYALTNYSAEKWALSRERLDILRAFDGVVVSGEERVVKPDERIYRILIERYDLDPAATYFTDDVTANVEAARSVGIDAERFIDAATTRTQLAARGLLEFGPVDNAQRSDPAGTTTV